MRWFRSLEFRLPLVSGLLLVAAIGAVATAAYVTVRRSTLRETSARLLGSSEQVAGLIKTSADTLRAVTGRVASAPAVRSYLRDPVRPAPAAVVAALQGDIHPDRLLAAQLVDARGRRLMAWGPFAGAVDSIRVAEIERMITDQGPSTLGGFRAVRDTVIYPVAAPVLDGGRRVGTVIHWRLQLSEPASRSQVAALFGAGPGSEVLLTDTARTMWTDLARPVPGPPVPLVPGGPVIGYERPGSGGRLAAAALASGTPWLAVIDVPQANVMEPVGAFLQEITVITLVCLLLALAAAWVYSRSITRPLVRLAGTADAFNEGNLAPRIPVDRDDELGHVAAAFNRMAERIQEFIDTLRDADRRKDEFLATLAHELRNPLAPIRSGLTLLREQQSPDPQAARYHEVMDRQLGVLTRLVDDLLDVSRITRGTVQIHREPVDLSVVVHQALDSARPLIASAGHQLNVEVPRGLVVLGDQVRLSQVVFNLLSNAARYTPSGGHISVVVRAQDTQAVIVVRDDGPGIPPDMLDRVFEMFVQLTPAKHGTGGLGVGLSLVRKLAELHGGSAEARSASSGRGSEFIVRLPLAPHRAPASRPDRAPFDEIPAGLTALVVDDNRDAADTLAEVLAGVGVNASVEYGGEAAVRAALADPPRIIFLDIGMPGMDGYEVARRVRAALGSQVMLVAVTGWGTDEDRRRSAEAGFDHHWVKPVRMDQLRNLLGSQDSPASVG